MLKILILILIISSHSFCGLPELFFENISGEYIMGKGNAHAMSAKYKIENVELTHEDIGVTFNRADKNLILLGPNTIVHFGFDFSFLNIFKALKFNGVNINLKERFFSATSTEVYTEVGKYDYTAKKVIIEADILNMKDPNNMDQILKSFIQKGLVRIKKINYKPVSKEQFKKDLISDNIETNSLSFSSKVIKASLRWLKLEVKAGKMSGSVLVDSWINAWLRFNGSIDHIKEEKLVKIKLTRAKLGYFNVRRFVYKALRKLESDKIKVKGNIIEILID